jgi:hypothetical protein
MDRCDFKKYCILPSDSILVEASDLNEMVQWIATGSNRNILIWMTLSVSIHHRSLSWFGTVTSVISGGVKLVLWAQSSLLLDIVLLNVQRAVFQIYSGRLYTLSVIQIKIFLLLPVAIHCTISAVMYLWVRGIYFASFYDFSIGFCNCSA